jgi:hypothetical protein
VENLRKSGRGIECRRFETIQWKDMKLFSLKIDEVRVFILGFGGSSV